MHQITLLLINNPFYYSGILVPGGFGARGTEGMVAAAKWARTKAIPYLGICLGMQIAVIEYARNVCGMKGNLHHFLTLNKNLASYLLSLFSISTDPKIMNMQTNFSSLTLQAPTLLRFMPKPATPLSSSCPKVARPT